jgi:hypothetical protein
MKNGRSVFRHLAVRIADHAAQASPRSRAEWASAMRAELEHISRDDAALMWAVGCIFASYSERMRTMISNNFRIARWILVLEMLCCFMPLTFLCLAVLANLGRLDGKAGILALTVVATGPIGLILTFRLVVLSHTSLTRFATTALWILAGWTGLAYSVHVFVEPEPAHAWREFVLIAVLPLVGIAHLLYLARRPVGKLAAA